MLRKEDGIHEHLLGTAEGGAEVGIVGEPDKSRILLVDEFLIVVFRVARYHVKFTALFSFGAVETHSIYSNIDDVLCVGVRIVDDPVR